MNTETYQCHACNFYGVMYPKTKYSQARKEEIINAYYERASMRGIQRIYGKAPATWAKWLKKAQNPIEEHLINSQADDVLELDEMWTFVQKRDNKVWLWLALCRLIKQIIGYQLGSRDAPTCQLFKDHIAPAYQNVATSSDTWAAYDKVFDKNTYESGRHRGQTNHIERFNATIRARIGRLVRKTLSFSKCDWMHQTIIHVFINRYNQQLADLNNPLIS